MAQAYGSSATLLLKREFAYGQAAAGDYIRIPFNRCTLGSEQGLIDDPVLGQGRDPYAPLQDAIMDEGEIVVPVDPRYIGLWLTGLLGTPTTTDDGADPATYTHEFVSGKDSLPSYTVEVGHSQVPVYFRHAGVVFDSIALEFARSGAAAATIQCVAQGEERFAASQGGTPTKLDFKRISQFQGSISRAGTAVANLTAGSLTYANNLEKIETIRSDGKIDGADPTVASLTGSIEVRFGRHHPDRLGVQRHRGRSGVCLPDRRRPQAHLRGPRGLSAEARAHGRRAGRGLGPLRLPGRP